jgi:AraC-like DNA-binding protein
MQHQHGRYAFSTKAFSEGERLDVWRELFGRHVAAMEMEPLEDSPFAGEAVVDVLPNIVISRVHSGPNRTRRTRTLLSDGSDNLVFTVLLGGDARAEQAGHEIALSEGEAVLWSNGHEGGWHYGRTLHFLTLAIPRNVLIPATVDVERSLLRPLRRDNQALQLLLNYVNFLQSELADIPLALRAVSWTHLLDLISLALGPTREAAETARGRGVMAARMQAVKADVLRNLTSRELSLEWIAARQGVSPRYIRALFAGEQTSFTEYVLNLRLDRARRCLENPRLAGQMVSTIAYECGFGDLSYFNQAFRRRFAATPTDVRKAASLNQVAP